MALLDNLVAFWKFDEASGTRVDSHGNNDLTDNGSVGSATGHVYGTGADFEADTPGDYLSINDNADLSLGADTDFTIAFWYKQETTAGAGGRIIFIKNEDFVGGTTSEYEMYVDLFERLNFVVGNGSSSGSVQTGGVASNGNWIFVICGHDSAADKLYVQVNNGTPTESAWSGGTQNGTARFSISDHFGTTWSLDGLIGPFMFWKDRWLSSDERTSLYNSGNGLTYANFGGGAISPIARSSIAHSAIGRSLIAA